MVTNLAERIINDKLEQNNLDMLLQIKMVQA